jgi:Prokaryotic N-terminal methylation motif
MELLKEEKGVTLVEVLLAMTLLTIILVSFLGMFPQMGFVNNLNQDKAQATNIAKEILINWEKSTEVQTFLRSSSQTSGFLPTHVNDFVHYTHFDPNKFTGYYYFETTKDIYDVQIKIRKSPNNSSNNSHIHQIIIQLLNDRGNVVSETFGYIKR